MMFACPEIHPRLESECGNSVTAVSGADDASDDAAEGALDAAGDCAWARDASAAKRSARAAAKTRGTAAEIEYRENILVLCGSAPTNDISPFARWIPATLCKFYVSAFFRAREGRHLARIYLERFGGDKSLAFYCKQAC
jgi:hypothetical protein